MEKQELIDYTVGGILEKYVAEDPDHEFMIYPDRGLRFTYKEFDERVNIFAKGLLSIGVTKGSKVGVWAKNVPDWMTFMFATAKIGAVLVTVNTNYKNAELEYIMKNADIHTMCMVNGYRDSDYVQILYDLVPELKTTQRGKLRSEKFPELRNVVYIGQEKLRGMYNTSELMKLGTLVGDDELERAKSRVDCHDEINMQYTSGTTGFPKGVMLTSHNILNNGLTIGDRMHFTAADRLLICVPLFHCFGCVLGVCSVITHGSTMVMVEDFDPLKVLASVHRERCTALHGVPTMFIAELHHPMFDMFDLSSLRTGIMAGAPCPIETMKQVMDKMYCKEIISVYGLTETSPGMTASATTDSMEIRATTVGRAFPNVEVKVLDPQTNEECPPGTPGEMCCKGYNIMKGYYKNPEATAAIIDENGFLHSGDLGVMDENGYFRITGRIKEMIIRGGENIYPRELEEFFFTHPAVADVQVIGIPDERYGEEIVAWIKLHPGHHADDEQLRAFCKARIAHFKIPRHFKFVDEFPMTVTGKIQKFRMREISIEEIRLLALRQGRD